MVLAGLAIIGLVGEVIFAAALVRSNTGAGGNVVSGVVPFVGYGVLVAEAVALVLLVVGFVRWPSRIIRSPRWVLSGLGVVLAAAGMLVSAFLAVTVAVQSP